jgi:hypothetical protein
MRKFLTAKRHDLIMVDQAAAGSKIAVYKGEKLK